VARLTIRLDDAFYDRLVADADSAGMPTATYVRDALEQLDGADPFGFHARFDELHSTVIQMLAIVASDVGARAPESLAKGMEDTRRLLLDRGLVAAEDLPGAGGGRRA
jgi:RHH-type rel operon transcriptional repressor/antitoxin RelB